MSTAVAVTAAARNHHQVERRSRAGLSGCRARGPGGSDGSSASGARPFL